MKKVIFLIDEFILLFNAEKEKRKRKTSTIFKDFLEIKKALFEKHVRPTLNKTNNMKENSFIKVC